MGKKEDEGLTSSPPTQPSGSDATHSNNGRCDENNHTNKVKDSVMEAYRDMYYNGDEIKEDMDMSALYGEEIIDGETIVPGYNKHRTDMALALERRKNPPTSKESKFSKLEDLSDVSDEENPPPSSEEKPGLNVLSGGEYFSEMFGNQAPKYDRAQESLAYSKRSGKSLDAVRDFPFKAINDTPPSRNHSNSVSIQTIMDAPPSFQNQSPKQYRGNDNRRQKTLPYSNNPSESVDRVRDVPSKATSGALPSRDLSKSVNIQTPMDVPSFKNQVQKQYPGNDNRRQKALPYSKRSCENVDGVLDVPSYAISNVRPSRDLSKPVNIQTPMDAPSSKNQPAKQYRCNDNRRQEPFPYSKLPGKSLREVLDVPPKSFGDMPRSRDYSKSVNIQAPMEIHPSKNRAPKYGGNDDRSQNSLPCLKRSDQNIDQVRDVPLKAINDTPPTKYVNIQTPMDAPHSSENQAHGNQLEAIIQDKKNEGEASTRSKTREEKILLGELEEGELTDDDDDNQPVEKETRRICKFFKRGQCTWGDRCKFLHPGVTNKGNYSMFNTQAPKDTFGGNKSAKSSESSSTKKELPYVTVGDVPFEIAWKRGLEKAREDLRRYAESNDTTFIDSLKPPVIQPIKIGVLELPVRRRRKTLDTIVIESSPEPELVTVKQEREDDVKPDSQLREENNSKPDTPAQEKVRKSNENIPIHYITLPDTKFPPPPLPNMSVPPPPIISIPPPPIPRMDLWPGLSRLPPNHFDLMRMRALNPPGPFQPSQFYFPPPSQYFLPPPPIRPANQQNVNVAPPQIYPHLQNNRNLPMYGQRDHNYDQKQTKYDEKAHCKRDEKGHIHSDRDPKSSRHRHHDYDYDHRNKRESHKRKSRSTSIPSFLQEKKKKADVWNDPWMRPRSSEMGRKKRKRSSSSSDSSSSSGKDSFSQAKLHAKLRALRDAKIRGGVASTSYANPGVASRANTDAKSRANADAKSRTSTNSSKSHASTSAKSSAKADTKSSSHADRKSHVSASAKSRTHADARSHTRADNKLRAVAHAKSHDSTDARASKKKSPIKFGFSARSHLVIPRAIVNVLDLHAAPNRMARMRQAHPIPEPKSSYPASSNQKNNPPKSNANEKNKVSASAKARKRTPRARESPSARKSSSSSESSASEGSGESSSSSSGDSSSRSSNCESDSSTSSDSDQQPKRRRKPVSPRGHTKGRKSPHTSKSREPKRKSPLEKSSSSDGTSGKAKRCKPHKERAKSSSPDEATRHKPQKKPAKSSSSDDSSDDEAKHPEPEEEHEESSSVEDFIQALMRLSPRSDDRCVKLAEKLKIIEDAIKVKQEEAERRGRPF